VRPRTKNGFLDISRVNLHIEAYVLLPRKEEAYKTCDNLNNSCILLLRLPSLVNATRRFVNVSTCCCSALSLKYSIHRIGLLMRRNKSTFAANFCFNFNRKQLRTYQVHDEDLVQETQAAQVSSNKKKSEHAASNVTLP